MLGGIGTWEILLIFLVILLLFGAKRIPDIAKSVGKGVTEFKRGLRDIQDEIETGVDPPSRSDNKTPDSEKTPKP